MEKSSKLTSWDWTFTKMNTINVPEPYGSSMPIYDSPEVRSRRRDITEMKMNKAWELVSGQGKTILMTIISFFFIGSNLSLFTIFIYGLYAYNNLSSIINVNTAFKMFESPEYSLLHYKLLYVVLGSVSLGFILYRIYGMGLIPLNPADWVSILDNQIIMDMIMQPIKEILNMKFRQILTQIVVLGTVVSSALMMWKGLMLITNSESPIVVVLTGSMEPSFYRGDILFINWDYTPPSPGDIVVFKVPNQEIPIVHRIIALQPLEHGDFNALTKGDNNEVCDRGLYEDGQLWLNKKHILGRIRGFLPYIGVLTIILNDYPMLKWGILILMGLFVLTSKDPNDT